MISSIKILNESGPNLPPCLSPSFKKGFSFHLKVRFSFLMYKLLFTSITISSSKLRPCLGKIKSSYTDVVNKNVGFWGSYKQLPSFAITVSWIHGSSSTGRRKMHEKIKISCLIGYCQVISQNTSNV